MALNAGFMARAASTAVVLLGFYGRRVQVHDNMNAHYITWANGNIQHGYSTIGKGSSQHNART